MRTIFLKGIQDEYIDVLNLMGTGDFSQLTFEDISNLCKKYSRSKAKNGKGIRDTRINKLTLGGVTRIELGNLQENFKNGILSTLSSQLDTIKTKKKQDEENAILNIFCSRCRKRHPLKECPLNTMSLFAFCTDKHQTENCPSFPELQAIFKVGNEESATRKPWHPRSLGGYQEQQNFMPYQAYPQPWKHQTSWQPWPSTSLQNSWRGYHFGNIPFRHPPHPMYPQQYPQ